MKRPALPSSPRPDSICTGQHADVIATHGAIRAKGYGGRCPVTRLWVLSHTTRAERRQAFATRTQVECPVCAPVTYRQCAGCYGTGWVAPAHASLIRRTL